VPEGHHHTLPNLELASVEDGDRQVRSVDEIPARRVRHDLTQIARIHLGERQRHRRSPMTVVA